MTPRTRAIVRAVTPVVAVVTMMVGLGVGARRSTRAAIVFGAAPGRPRPDGRVVLAWQVRTALEDRGVREASPDRGVTITARSGPNEARWHGRTNADGIAEASLAFESLAFGDAIALVVQDDDGTMLAQGTAAWDATTRPTKNDAGDAGGMDDAGGASGTGSATRSVRPTKVEGDVRLDVAIDGDRLVPGFPTSVWVRPSSKGPDTPAIPRGSSEIDVHVDPEPGLSFARDGATTCDGGWAELRATAHAHVVGATFAATTSSGKMGSWFGALPTLPGAFYVDAPRVMPAERAASVAVIAPNPRKVVYLEIDDDLGRVAADAQDLRAATPNDVPRATFSIPPLARGTYRLFASGDPSVLEGSFIGRTVTLGDPDTTNMHHACIDRIPTSPGSPTPRWIALDGFLGQEGPARRRRAIGVFLAIAALGIAASIEVLLLVGASREAKRVARELATDEGIEAPRPGGNLAVGILVVLLGFALLATLILTSK